MPNNKANGEPSVPKTVKERLAFHEKVKQGTNCDLETANSVLCGINIKQLLTPAAFDALPPTYQNELIRLLPESDRLLLKDEKRNKVNLQMTVTALSNEFFAKSCVEYKDRLKNGEFSVTAPKTEGDQVIWECEPHILDVPLVDTGVPKAGKPFRISSKEPDVEQSESRSSKNKHSKKSKKEKPIKTVINLKSLTATTSGAKSSKSSSSTTMDKSISSSSKSKVSESCSLLTVKSEPSSSASSVKSSGDSQIINNSKNRKPIIITPESLLKDNRKPPDSKSLVKKIPTITTPHDQVVTTLPSCNSILRQLIKRPSNGTTVQIQPNKRQATRINNVIYNSRMVTPVIVTLRNQPQKTNGISVYGANKPIVVSRQNGQNHVIVQTSDINKAISIAKSHVTNSITNTRNTPTTQIVNVKINGATEMTKNSVSPPTSVKLIVRTTQPPPESLVANTNGTVIASSSATPTVDLERSLEICKQVLGTTGGNTGGLRSLIGSQTNKLVRPDLSNKTCDIPLYKSRYRGKTAPTLTSHLFLALKDDETGYTNKALKKRSALKVKPKKKSVKPSRKPSESALVTCTCAEQLTTTTDSVINSLMSTAAPSGQTGNIFTSSSHVSQILPQSCICASRALVICSKCGAFSHPECSNKDLCLSCSNPRQVVEN